MRFDALDLEDGLVLRILLATDRPAALARLAHGGHLDTISLLESAESLLESGEDREAHRIFLQARRTEANCFSIGDQTLEVQSESLVRWGLTARLFLPIADVIRAFEEHYFEFGEPLGIEPNRDRPPVDQARSRTIALVRFALALLDHNAPANSTVCAEAITWPSVQDGFRQLFLLARAAAAQRAGENVIALADLAEARALPLVEISAKRLLQMAEVSFFCGERNLAVERLKEIPPPDLRQLEAGRMATQAEPRLAFRWLRLSETLRVAPPLSEILRSGDAKSEGGQIMARARALASQIWASGRRGDDIESAELGRRISNLLRVLHQQPENILEWRGVNDMHEIRWEITQLLPPACAASGKPGLQLLETALAEAWTDPFKEDIGCRRLDGR